MGFRKRIGFSDTLAKKKAVYTNKWGSSIKFWCLENGGRNK